MKWSVIIPYRDREEHLSLLLPRLLERFAGRDFEILIAEQADMEKFRLSSLYDVAFKQCTGDVIVFHDVDYYPSDDVSYIHDEDSPVYPVRRVLFVDKSFNPYQQTKFPVGIVTLVLTLVTIGVACSS